MRFLKGDAGATLAAAVRRALSEPRQPSEEEQRWYVEQHVGGRVVVDGPMTNARAREIEWQRQRQGVPGLCRIVQKDDAPTGDVIDVRPAPPKLDAGPLEASAPKDDG